MLNLLSVFGFFDKKPTSSAVIIINAAMLVTLVVIIAVISVKRKSFNTKTIVFGGISVALSFALSFVKVYSSPFGGSVTLASLLPICVFAYTFGIAPALFAGVTYGMLQFFQSPSLYTYATLFLDYILPFSSVVMTAVARKFIKNETAGLLIGIFLTCAFRFACHFGSGIIFFNAGYIVSGLPADNAFIYSFCYNAIYLVPDTLITIIAAFILEKTRVIPRLIKISET